MKKRIRKIGMVLILLFLCFTSKSKVVSASEIAATDLDLGEYQKEMTVGTSQLLTITVLPVNSTNQEVSYVSSNNKILEVNVIGRITANSIGKAEITISCGNVKKVLKIEVKETASEDSVNVNTIEVDEYKEEMKVNETQTITATITPVTSINSAITYSSSDTSVATIGSNGKITAKKKGSTNIYLMAGNIKKELKLKVTVATTKISTSTNYSVLSIGDVIDLGGQVYPKDADQSLSYKSTNSQIVSVTENGRVTAKACGSSSIIVSNGDLQTITTIIVNESKAKESIEQLEKNSDNTISEKNELLSMIKAVKEEKIHLQANNIDKISCDVLKYVYENKKTLIIQGNMYTLTLKGSDIVNFDNEWNPIIEFKNEKEGTTLIINEGNNIPGIIYLQLSDELNLKGKYIYLYNQGKDKYELLNTKINQGELKVNITGKYMITERKIKTFHWNFVLIELVVACLIGGGITYIFVARKYWFW